MTGDIKTLIAEKPAQARVAILLATERFINAVDLHKYTIRLQEVGAIRRGESKARFIELLIVPMKKRHHQLERFLTAISTKRDLSNTYTWFLIWQQVPVILHLATAETFVVGQLLTTGPEDFVRQVQEATKAKDYRLDATGFYKGNRLIIPFGEAEILETIGLPYVPPQKRAAYAKELREGQS